MRSPRTHGVVFSLLVLAALAHGAAFAQRAHACRFMRMTAAERPSCCSLSAQDRFTRPGGDCCKHLSLDEPTPATARSLVHPVPPAAALATPAPVLATRPPTRLRASAPPAAERAPPIPLLVETVVLRL